jgi:hypothetical protein
VKTVLSAGVRMARVSVKTIFVTSLLVCQLAAKGLCSPESSEDSFKYPNDEEGDDEGDFDDDHTPVMKSTPQIFEVSSGERVVLPCATVNHSSDVNRFAVKWDIDGRILYLDTVQSEPKDPRITYRSSDSSLVITNVTVSDSGHYCCIYSSDPPLKLIHVINVFAPAAIRSIQPKGHVSVEKGSTVTLKCNVIGYPHPVVEWKKLGKHEHTVATVIATSENVTLNSVERFDSGTYECTASNSLGPKVSAQVSIHVTYAPQIDIDEELVTSGEDYETKLKCVVHADPKAEVYWLKDNASVSDLDHVHTFTEGNKHYYHIAKTQVSDFGKYKCIATNSKGTNSKEIELTGRPLTPHLNMASVGGDGRSLDVEWLIVSYLPIIEYRVQYKNKKDNGKWQMLTAPVEDAEEGNVYKLRYQLKDLPDGEFLVSLVARNSYGWTNPAKPQSFTIKNESNEATAETSKLEEGHPPSDCTRPRITAVLMIISFYAFFL